MKKRYILLGIVFSILVLLLMGTKSNAAELDRIQNYIVTVEPRMNDGTLDITYEITWKVLDSTTEGPLEWVKIGTPNSNFDTIIALTKNIRSISKYSGSNVKIVFDRKYYEGEFITFKYSIHQSYMYQISGSNCNYDFTPAWFTDAKVDSLTVKWNSDKVTKSNSRSKEDNYLVWRKTNMAKGEKLNISIKYDKASFSALNENKQAGQKKSSNTNNSANFWIIFITIIFVVLIIVSISGGGGGYYGHRGFYGGGYRGGFYGGCVHSSCACACAHSSCASSCACACAGSGRAGCSKKDFYGTNLNTKKLKRVMEKTNKEQRK